MPRYKRKNGISDGHFSQGLAIQYQLYAKKTDSIINDNHMFDYASSTKRTNTNEIVFLFSQDVDSCEEWMGCRSETLLSYLARLQDLPNCPCSYPTNIRQNNAIWDLQKRQMFHWKDASGDEAKLPVYKPTAEYCIISTLSPPSTSLASQQCCYDDNQKLITRGPGAGTPQLISAEISPELHYKIDVMPWIICKGDLDQI